MLRSVIAGVIIFLLTFIGLRIMTQEKNAKIKSWKSIEKKKADERIENLTGKKQNFYTKFKIQAEEVLKLSNSKLTYTHFLYLTAASSVVGIAIGFLFRNPLLSIILGVAFLLLPLEVMRIKLTSYKQYENEQLQSTLGVITNSYLQCDDIVKAVKDNLSGIEQPLYSIFNEFVTLNSFVEVNTVKNLYRLKSKLNNQQAKEWVDILILCQDNKDQKYTLPAIVQQMGDLKSIQEAANTMMYKIYKEFCIVAGLAIAIIPGLKILNKDWYDILTGTFGGKCVVATAFLIIIISAIRVIKVNKPVEM